MIFFLTLWTLVCSISWYWWTPVPWSSGTGTVHSTWSKGTKHILSCRGHFKLAECAVWGMNLICRSSFSSERWQLHQCITSHTVHRRTIQADSDQDLVHCHYQHCTLINSFKTGAKVPYSSDDTRRSLSHVMRMDQMNGETPIISWPHCNIPQWT